MKRPEKLPAVHHARVRDLLAELAPLQPRKRLDALLERQDLPQLLPAMPIQDVYGLIQQVGVADAMELLEAAPPSVLQGITDFAVWRMDRVDPRSLAQFYAALFHADPDGAVEKVLAMDLELFTLFLKLHAVVAPITDDGVPDMPSEDTWRTPDGKYVVAFVDAPGLPTEEQDSMGLGERGRALARSAARQLVLGLTDLDAALVSRILDSIRYELPSHLEDEAQRWREGRLADLGFPPREEAMRTLAFLDPDTQKLRAPAPVAPPDEEEGFADPALALYTRPDSLAREPFLTAALKPLTGEKLLERLRELAVLCNRVAVARDIPLGELDAMRGVVLEVRTLLDLGLAYRARGQEADAAGVLATASMEDVYRVGNSLTLKLQRQARRLMQPHWGPPKALARLLDAPLGLALAALLGRMPQFFNGLQKPGALTTRAFATLEDLALAARGLSDAAFRLAMAFDVLGFKPESLTAAALHGTNLADRAEVTVETLFTTALCRVLGGGALEASPLSAAELAACRGPLADAQAVLAAARKLSELAVQKVPLPGCRTAKEVEDRCNALSAVLCARLLDETAGVSGELDGRFVTRALVLVKAHPVTVN